MTTDPPPLKDAIRLAAEQSHFHLIESCCGVPGKFCGVDVWRGNLEGFARRLLALLGHGEK